MQGFYQMRIWCVLVCVFALSVVGFSQTKKSAAKKKTPTTRKKAEAKA